MNLPSVFCQLLLVFCPFVLPASVAGEAPLKNIKLPAGFEITLFADNVPDARSMTLSPNGTLFVGTREAGKVYAISTQGGSSRRLITIAHGLNSPNGVAFRNGALYVAEASRVLRYDNIEPQLSGPPKPVVVNSSFSTDRSHGWKFIAFGPNGSLYVPVGAPCNICEADPNRYAVITRMKPAEHGSWNRSTAIGYRITLVELKDNRPVSYETFAESWLQEGKPWGRPVDVLVVPDGALLVSDDHGGRIYRISYKNSRRILIVD